MTDVLKLGKRAFTVAVALATILWSIGISAFVLPLQANAASAGDLIRGETLSTVYYYASDGSRYAFTGEASYFTWYEDFDDVEWMTDSEIAALPLAGNIVNRPGSFWVKIQSDPKTYAVTPQGQIRWIESEEVATDLAGSDWNQFILDVSDSFFPDYTVGTSLMDAGDAYNGALVDMDGTTYLVWNDEMREVTDAGFDANGFQERFILDGDGIDLAGLSTGSDVTGEESGLTDAAQLGEEVTGGLSVSLASDTPASATVPAGAASVPFTKVKLTATSGSASISQLVFKLGGVGDVANIDEVYLYEGDMRLTDGRDVNSSTREVTFSALNLDLSSGESMYLTVRADISDAPTGGDSASFYLASESSVVGTATVSGSFPVSGNTMTFSETEAGTVDVDKVGTISDPTIGEDDAVIAKFSVEAMDEDASVEQITLNIDDAGDHSDFKLWDGDDLLASGESDGDELVTFTLTNPFALDEGDSETLEVSADIGGEADDTIAVGVEEEADILAIGGDFGFNMAADITDYDATGSLCDDDGDDCSFSVIIGGELTFAFNGPATDDIQIDGEDQVLMEFTITAENWTEIQELVVNLACDDASASGCDVGADDGDLLNSTDDEPNLQDVTIRTDDGSTWMGPEELDATDADAASADDETQDLLFEDTQILQAGESIDLMITVDVFTGAVEGDIYVATIITDETVAEDANGDALDVDDDIVPSADIVGNEFELTDASLDISVSSTPASGTYVKGASNVDVVGFNFEAGEASDVTVTELTFAADGDTDADDPVDSDDFDVGDQVSSCSIYDKESGSLVDGPESFDADEEVTFDSFDWTVEAGETQKLVLRCNYSNVLPDGGEGDDDTYIFYIDDVDANVTAEDEDGDEVEATLDDDNDDSETVITIIDAGDMTITLDGSTPNSTIILGSSTGVEVGSWKFDADDEAFTVTTLTFENGGDDEVADSVTVSCLDESGATVTSTSFISGGEVMFDNLECYVPTTSTRVIDVMIDTNTVSTTGGADSGDTFELTIDLSDAGAFEAVGSSSGETIDEDDVGADVAANDFELRKTKPTVSLASGSPSGAGVPGLSEAFRFNVAADSRGFVQMNEVLFKVTTTDGDGSDWNICDGGEFDDPDLWELYDVDDSSEKLDDDDDWEFFESDGSCDGGDLAFAWLDFEDDGTTPAEEIGAGETKTYVLRVDTTGASSSDDDSIRIDIPDEEEATDDVGLDAFNWEDDSEGSDDVGDPDDDDDDGDIDGEFVKNLPVTGGTIVY
jgi:hypothetical protein